MASSVVHTAHCCPAHGCKYNNDDGCPVVNGEKEPMYPGACEQCADEKETARSLSERVKDQIVAESPTLQLLIEERDALRQKIKTLEGRSPGTYDVALVVFTRVEDAQDFSDAASIAEMALKQLMRNHGERMPKTGTMALYAKHGDKTFGPVKIARVAEINSGTYDAGIIRKVSTAPYRFWDLTPEQIEEMNREDMGG